MRLRLNVVHATVVTWLNGHADARRLRFSSPTGTFPPRNSPTGITPRSTNRASSLFSSLHAQDPVVTKNEATSWIPSHSQQCLGCQQAASALKHRWSPFGIRDGRLLCHDCASRFEALAPCPLYQVCENGFSLPPDFPDALSCLLLSSAPPPGLTLGAPSSSDNNGNEDLCFFCGFGEDSNEHYTTWCPLLREAEIIFLGRPYKGLSLSPLFFSGQDSQEHLLSSHLLHVIGLHLAKARKMGRMAYASGYPSLASIIAQLVSDAWQGIPATHRPLSPPLSSPVGIAPN